MSIFSIIKKGKQQAKEQPRERDEQEREGDERPAYKHVPTHRIAGDALAGSPLSPRTEDRPRTAGDSRGKSAMASPSAVAPSRGILRVSNDPSNGMHPSANANPIVPAQRYSYDVPRLGHSQCHRANVGVVYRVPDPTYIPEVPRISPPKGGGFDPLSKPGSPRITMGSSRAPLRRENKGNGSTTNSNNSSSSQNGSEAKRPERPTLATRTTAPPMTPGASARAAPASNVHHSRSSSSTEIHRLHPSRQRRLSDASVEMPLSGPPRRGYQPGLPRDSRPPLSMRGFDSIPPVPTFPLLSRPINHSQVVQNRSNMASPPSSLDGSDSWTSSSRATSYNSRMTPSSSVSPTGSSDSCTSVSPSAASEFVFPFTSEAKPASDMGSQPSGTATPSIAAQLKRDAVKVESPRSGVQAHPPLTEATDSSRSGSKTKKYYPPKASRSTDAMGDADTGPPSRSTRITSWLSRRLSQSSRVSVETAPTTDGESTEVAGGMNMKDVGRKKLTKAKPSKMVMRSQ